MVRSIHKLIISAFIVSLLGMGTAHARYLQTDPIGYEDDVNLYAYVGNDPVNATDPDGKQTVWEMQREEEAFAASLQGKTPDEQHAAIMERSSSQLSTMATVASFALPGGLIVRGGIATARAVGLTRVAARFAPAASRTATLQRFTFAKSASATLKEGGGTAILGAGAKKGGAFRDAALKAEKYGGEAKDYAKVSVTTVTKSGERLSVHAVRNVKTGRVYEEKLLVGR